MNSRIALIIGPGVFGIVSAFNLVGCGGSTASTVNSPPSSGSTPIPTIATISPNGAAAGGAAFTLTIIGTNFVAASVVAFGGTSVTTTFVNSTQLTAAIPAAAIAAAGSPAVTVTNPAPGGGTSNALSFTIGSGTNPIPTLSSLSPSCGPAGQQTLNPFANGQLYVVGQNFVASSVVRWNGSDRPTTFYSTSQLSAQISASDIAATGTATVTVFNPAPGGGSSNASTFTITTGGVGPQSIAVDPAGKFAYVANEGCGDSTFGNVSMYTINPDTGALASIGPPVTSNDEGGRAVTVDPNGKFAYVANSGAGDTAGSISTYAINGTTGALTSTGSVQAPCVPSPGSCAPWSLAVHPSGKFAYVANEGGFTPTSVSMYSIDATTGALTSIGLIPTEGRATYVSVDPSGKFAYVANGGENSDGSPGVNVLMYAINATTGALTSIGTVAADSLPTSIAVHPSGKFTYVANAGSNNVSLYTIDTTTGALTSAGLVAAGTGPTSLALDPAGRFAYVVNSRSNDVSMYTVNGTTGALTSIATTGAGLFPTSLAVHPSGKFVYVANAGSNSVWMYSIDATTGALTLMGTIGT
jgi:6-phosphogluconolactonase (cycloisomerase 2 family)